MSVSSPLTTVLLIAAVCFAVLGWPGICVAVIAVALAAEAVVLAAARSAVSADRPS